MTGEEFAALRPSAFAVAYRMLGSVSEAEDVVQEGFLRLHRARAGGERIESPRAYLSTVVSRLALDHLRSARARRETYVGEWLPEPLVGDDPARRAEIADSLSLAFLVLLESLSPEQRAAFLLREVFDEPYDRIAEIVGTSEGNARQLAARARRHVDERRGGRVRFQASREQREALATRFFAAAEEGDLQGLEELLAHDVVFRGDGGGKAPAAARAVHGRTKVARLLIAGLRTLAGVGGVTTRREEVNGQPGVLYLDRDKRLIGVTTLDIADGQIQGVSAIVNSDKLRHLGPVGDVRALLRERR